MIMNDGLAVESSVEIYVELPEIYKKNFAK
jgi:hypothetical protein